MSTLTRYQRLIGTSADRRCFKNQRLRRLPPGGAASTRRNIHGHTLFKILVLTVNQPSIEDYQDFRQWGTIMLSELSHGSDLRSRAIAFERARLLPSRCAFKNHGSAGASPSRFGQMRLP